MGLCGGISGEPPKGAGIERGRGRVECRTRTEQTVKDARGWCGGITGEPFSEGECKELGRCGGMSGDHLKEQLWGQDRGYNRLLTPA